jgi:hypothetical protein
MSHAFDAFLRTEKGEEYRKKYPSLDSILILAVNNNDNYKVLNDITITLDTFQDYLGNNEDNDDVIKPNSNEIKLIKEIYKEAMKGMKLISEQNRKNEQAKKGFGGRKSKMNKRRITRRKRSIKNKRSMNKNRQIR